MIVGGITLLLMFTKPISNYFNEEEKVEKKDWVNK
jgi:hypothetical protein